MNWAQIRQLYLSACGQAQTAANEANMHLSEGQRTVSARMPLQETESIQDEQATVASQDWVPLPETLFHVLHVYEKVNGNEILPEEGGMRGRARFLAPTTGKPAEGGPPTNYAISNGKMYLRPTPESTSYTIVIRGKEALGEITDANMGDSPTLPEHYHMAIGLAAAQNYLAFHPESLKEMAEGTLVNLERQLTDRLKAQELPKERERFDKRGRIRLPGFRLGMR